MSDYTLTIQARKAVYPMTLTLRPFWTQQVVNVRMHMKKCFTGQLYVIVHFHWLISSIMIIHNLFVFCFCIIKRSNQSEFGLLILILCSHHLISAMEKGLWGAQSQSQHLFSSEQRICGKWQLHHLYIWPQRLWDSLNKQERGNQFV